MLSRLDLSQFRLGPIRNWAVSITPKRVDSLPYSKIKSLSHLYRQRLLASRSAPVGFSELPPVTTFVFQPTPSYVLSPQLAARLSKPELSSLASPLGVYKPVLVDNTETGEVDVIVGERNCIPEVTVDPDLNGADQALYFGHGQLQVMGMLGIFSADVKNNTRFCSASDLQRLLVSECIRGRPSGFADVSETSINGSSTWVYNNTDKGQQRLARVSTDVDYDEGIATASITLNLEVPTPGLDPDRTCPYSRLAAIGVESRFTTCWARDGVPVSNQDQTANRVGREALALKLFWAIQHAFGTGPCPMPDFVDHSRALGASDPDFEPEDYLGRRLDAWTRIGL